MLFLSQTNKKKTDMGNKRTTIMVGSFVVESGYIVCGDPCYRDRVDVETYACKNGKYNVYIEIGDYADWGKRVAKLIAIHEYDDYDHDTLLWEYNGEMLGVDGGTCGVYDERYWEQYHNNEINFDSWYDKYICGELEDCLTIDNRCVVSSSGFGDGVYDCDLCYDNDDEDDNTICAVMITYIEKDDEE